MTRYLKFYLNKGREYLLFGSCIQPKKRSKVQIIGILEEMDSFHWPKMHLWKGDKEFGQGPSPWFGQIQKEQHLFFLMPSLTGETVQDLCCTGGHDWHSLVQPRVSRGPQLTLIQKCVCVDTLSPKNLFLREHHA